MLSPRCYSARVAYVAFSATIACHLADYMPSAQPRRPASHVVWHFTALCVRWAASAAVALYSSLSVLVCAPLKSVACDSVAGARSFYNANRAGAPKRWHCAPPHTVHLDVPELPHDCLSIVTRLPVRRLQAWQLNERMYGALTGLNKAQTKAHLGEVRTRTGSEPRDPSGIAKQML